MDINILLTIALGLGVPLIIFYITYKKTVGASIEREKTAYREIVSLIAKLIAHEEIKPNFDIINGLIKSKAREYNVNLDVSYIPTIFEDVMAKFIENEFISQSVKKNLIDKVQLTQKEIFEAKETKEANVSEKADLVFEKNKILLSTLTALVGTLFIIGTIFQKYSEIYEPLTKEFILTTFVAIITIAITTMVFYVEKMEKTKSKERINMKYGTSIFEDMVFTALKSAFPSEVIKKNVILNEKEVDFLLISNNETIPIEVKYRILLFKSVKKLKDFMIESNVNKVMLITNSSAPQKVKKFATENNIILIDNVQSEEDIVNKIKNYF